MRERFWETYALEELTLDEWEALCDGCALCCLVKLQDEDTNEVLYTSVSCRYLDTVSCRCTIYGERTAKVPGCVSMTPSLARALSWLPDSCAYRRVAEGKPLPRWHHLECGDHQQVHQAAASVRGKVISELMVPEGELEEHVAHWVEHPVDLRSDKP